jgi:hypothetical protein
MPLQVFSGGQQALNVYFTGIGLNAYRRYDVGMGGFAAANNPNTATALGTSGAGPCQIIVVHKAAGLGALGHYPGDDRPDQIVQGVQSMVQQLGGPPIARIVFAAGQIGNAHEQFLYEVGVVGRVRALGTGARVVWPRVPINDVWGACYYLPLSEQIGLLMDSPGGFVGSGNAANGITVHNY